MRTQNNRHAKKIITDIITIDRRQSQIRCYETKQSQWYISVKFYEFSGTHLRRTPQKTPLNTRASTREITKKAQERYRYRAV